MALKFLVIEDNGARRTNLESAARTQLGALVDEVGSLHQLVNGMDASDLAEYAGILVDFDLETVKAPGYTSWEPLTVSSAEGPVSVPLMTGMAAFVYLRQQFGSASYQRARAAWLAIEGADARAWSTAGGGPMLFSFVETKDWLSRLFAAAAHSWFGATYLNAQLTAHELGQLLADPASIAGVHTVRRVVQASMVLDHALAADPMGRRKFIPEESRPTGFDWYAIYLAHKGKAGWSRQALADAVHKVCGAPVVARHLSPAQYEPVAALFQSAMNDVVAEFVPGEEWAGWKLGERPDPLREVLADSSLFWTAPDVRAAFQLYGRRGRRAS